MQLKHCSIRCPRAKRDKCRDKSNHQDPDCPVHGYNSDRQIKIDQGQTQHEMRDCQWQKCQEIQAAANVSMGMNNEPGNYSGQYSDHCTGDDNYYKGVPER